MKKIYNNQIGSSVRSSICIVANQKVTFGSSGNIELRKGSKKGEIIEQPIYSYITHSRSDDFIVVHPKEILIIEGILVFTNEALRKLCDIKIFVHTDADERLIRRIKRDINERGRDIEEVINRYEKTLKPMHNRFIEPTMKYADMIVPVGGENKVAIDILTSMIKEKIGTLSLH